MQKNGIALEQLAISYQLEINANSNVMLATYQPIVSGSFEFSDETLFFQTPDGLNKSVSQMDGANPTKLTYNARKMVSSCFG